MNILHYSLGFPPYRTGGLTKFCIDLMSQQCKDGHDVSMLWPGQIGFLLKKTKIKNRGFKICNGEKIKSLELTNPLPIPLDEGIKQVSAYTMDCETDVYKNFFDKFQPDVIHIHTLMGIHKSFLIEAKKRNIRTVFTTHDYFPICPKVTMFRDGKPCDSVTNFKFCESCNDSALSINKIKILQSPIYRRIKNLKLVKKLRKLHRDSFFDNTSSTKVFIEGSKQKYSNLREYYYSLLNYIDTIHFNSSVAEEIYQSIFNIKDHYIINITHQDIRDKRRVKDFSTNLLRISYLGPQSKPKGYFLLKEACDKLWDERKDFCLNIYFDPTEKSPYMRTHGAYSYKDLEHIFNETDILVVPSIWYETFGFTILEALSFGVPVIISDTVGAKDILSEGAGIIIEDITAEKLHKILTIINIDLLKQMNKKILECQKILLMPEMSKSIAKKCYRAPLYTNSVS